ncbi:MAG TPA: sigma-54 dependent transcriptional regulator [Thermoanaerobaculia bacterium]|nr:sigma-54 dependent transcriptional regulator [Thermoanaerobaculia bacterium]HPA96616.1 sigma-54 dependent transcriptional regulator [Thermoanaerobaculia bacterium]HQN38531.1 sigma-54 dependent transcriptional regulator [Thermoanaerobaculia bacterium]HRR12999.1 sigma-54 dependent transcriptional regulator [Thermoanaerobaculia bacterium]HRS36245.1 sigma-54 dependent transcriptional regulator [Thermoanaerobaculia bacterium]
MSEPTVLLVEDDSAVRHGIAAYLRANGLAVDEAETCQQAMERFRAVIHDVVVADYSLPDGTSLDILPQVKKLAEATPFVILTAHGSIDLAVRAIKDGAEQFLTKPVESKALLVLVRRLLQQQRLRKRQEIVARTQPGLLDPFVGRSLQIRQLEERARLMLDWDSPLLILGETGSGKGVLARWIHANGPRREEAFVNLNCAGLTRELLESELFGHERGAFTGAVNPKPGLLEVGHRGIVFLDEIGDMDPAIQPKLLKALEEKTFRRLGDVRDRHVDIRLVASTNLDLEEAVRSKRFRDDLYYRISTLTLRIPSLRERPDDVLVLGRSILASVCGRIGRAMPDLTPDAEEVLRRYPWPGNIRELANVLERSMILIKGDTLDAAGLGLETAMPAPPPEDGRLLTMREMERQHVERVLARTGGNVTEAAEILGIARRTLYDRMKRLGLGVGGE